MTKWYVRSLFAAAFGAAAVNPAFAAGKDDAPVAATAPTGDVDLSLDVAYGQAADDRQKLDLYLPRGKAGYPVVVFFHGGGFSKGDRKEAAKFGETLVRQGIGVAAAGYRLYPQAKHPDQADDAAKAVAWVKRSIAGRGGNPDRVFVAGHSAGGLLAALLATDERYLKSAGLTGSKDLAGVISLSGAYSVGENRKDVFGDEAGRKAASPLAHVRAGLPPFLLVYADKDQPGRDQQTREFADALKGAKVSTEVVEAKDRDHGSLFTRIEAGDPTGQTVAAFVRATSGGSGK